MIDNIVGIIIEAPTANNTREATKTASTGENAVRNEVAENTHRPKVKITKS